MLRKERNSVQAPPSIIMIRPHQFKVNPETSVDNAFQVAVQPDDAHSSQAFEEISLAAIHLEDQGIQVHLFDDTNTITPDSVFPNNWFSTHSGGHVAVYPMKAENRRLERRQDILEMLKKNYRVQDIIDYSGLEEDNLFLEGTGAMVLDHIDRVAYAAKSDRTSQIVLERFCTHFNFEPMAFSAVDSKGVPIYHTNVLMCIATDYALIGLSMIKNPDRRNEIIQRLEHSGRRVIDLSEDQIGKFAGNAIELQGKSGRILALSQTAYDALTDDQKAIMRESTKLVPLNIPTIEMAGGSVRCTIAGIHLSARH
ncbi:arginine deiminase-related protein [Terasakiella sp. A23]|uniref:citrulline utilization hydrolase CtlX n=1 Tax=Terasakiella sp. FCG-A23 TaxID=3080561 RepID=UPI0029555F02|nr:arginine deiminase-related protein [Terasakiella sp. A23]MDV7340676.1 arginine deiminase-related protein [Terasakiella sp. A23]